MVNQFFDVENVEVMAWYTQRPDLSPIKNLSKIISDNVRARKLTTVTDLWQKPQK